LCKDIWKVSLISNPAVQHLGSLTFPLIMSSGFYHFDLLHKVDAWLINNM